MVQLLEREIHPNIFVIACLSLEYCGVMDQIVIQFRDKLIVSKLKTSQK